jgi:hypothetical protein
MNERIKLLAVTANPSSQEIYESDSWKFNCAAWSAEDLKKFAELIVKECMKAADEGMAQVTMKVEWPSFHIKKHFGVE